MVTHHFVLCDKAEDPPGQQARAEDKRDPPPVEFVAQSPISRWVAEVEPDKLRCTMQRASRRIQTPLPAQ
jgi:hypothetical protein